MEHIFIFEGNGIIRDFNGSYTEYRLSLGTQKSYKNHTQNNLKKIEKKKETKAKLSFKEKYEFENLEKEIEHLEKEKTELELLISENSDDYEFVNEKAKILDQLIKDIDTKTDRWMTLSEY